MEKLKRSLSIRKKKIPRLESSKPHQWQEDERKVRDGTCSFQVKYLGCVEVYESRGIQICEEAVKVLKAKKSRSSAWSRLSFRKKKDDSQQPKSGHHRAILYVTGDALRVVDEISKGLIVDQTIEKVSFCAPDRNHERGFAYICRDGTTRRWLCHGFFAIKESGERLSHAVGCAFGICLEKKQQREKEKVSVTYNENGTSFTRMGSFRQTTLTERLTDPQSAIVAEPVPFKPTEMPFAVQRPHAPANILDRQGSFRGFNKLAESSPFKRNTSLLVNELPSTLERQKQFSGIDGPQLTNGKTPIISTIIEDEELPPSMLEEPSGSQWPVLDSFSSLKLNNSSVPVQTTAIIQPPPPVAQSTVQPPYSTAHAGAFTGSESLQLKNSQIVTSLLGNMSAGNSHIEAPQLGVVVKQTNPWAAPKPPESRSSEAENWLNSTANRIDPFAAVPPPCSVGVSRQRSVNSGFGGPGSVAMATSPVQAAPTHESHHAAQAHAAYPGSVAAVPVVVAQHQILSDPRFPPSVDRSWMTGPPGSSPGVTVDHSTAAARGSMFAPSSASVAPVGAGVVPSADPFDSAWAARATAKSANPFHPAGASFQVKI